MTLSVFEYMVIAGVVIMIISSVVEEMNK